MADTQKGPFDRVANGYDPRQVAAFAAEALGWKRDLAACRNELRSVQGALDHYESVIGAVEDIEREAESITADAERRAAEIIERAEEQAARILETATGQGDSERTEPEDQGTSGAASPDAWSTPDIPTDGSDPIEEIFEPIDDALDPETEREARLAAATANLWKRRGVLAPPE